ncbi:MAG: hypothetical protein ACI8ZA_001466 [Gammaproteobacteria bacterium]|jgi:hypothetical protein
MYKRVFYYFDSQIANCKSTIHEEVNKEIRAEVCGAKRVKIRFTLVLINAKRL